jgi:protein required for attachment to host cells
MTPKSPRISSSHHIRGKSASHIMIDEYIDSMDILTEKLNANKAEKMKKQALDELFGEK